MARDSCEQLETPFIRRLQPFGWTSGAEFKPQCDGGSVPTGRSKVLAKYLSHLRSEVTLAALVQLIPRLPRSSPVPARQEPVRPSRTGPRPETLRPLPYP